MDLPFQQQRIDDFLNTDHRVIEQFDHAGLGVDFQFADMGAIRIGCLSRRESSLIKLSSSPVAADTQTSLKLALRSVPTI